MTHIKTNLIIIFAVLLTSISCAKKNTNMTTDYLNAGKEIVFDKEKYNLVWSAHPSDNYYKEEYLPEKDTLDRFRKLILFEAVIGNIEPKEAADSKVEELKKMKESDPMVNYELFDRRGEVMLDFLVSQNMSGDNDSGIVERNVYRYSKFVDKNGVAGLLLFGVSERAYGNDISNYLISLKEKRFIVPDAVSSFVIPEITISK